MASSDHYRSREGESGVLDGGMLHGFGVKHFIPALSYEKQFWTVVMVLVHLSS